MYSLIFSIAFVLYFNCILKLIAVNICCMIFVTFIYSPLSHTTFSYLFFQFSIFQFLLKSIFLMIGRSKNASLMRKTQKTLFFPRIFQGTNRDPLYFSIFFIVYHHHAHLQKISIFQFFLTFYFSFFFSTFL